MTKPKYSEYIFKKLIASRRNEVGEIAHRFAGISKLTREFMERHSTNYLIPNPKRKSHLK